MPRKYCCVPGCGESVTDSPSKIFISVPLLCGVREKWLQLAKIETGRYKPKTVLFFCQDHFDLPNDMKNYETYLASTSKKKRVILKPGCMPSKFSWSTGKEQPVNDPQSADQKILQRCNFLFGQALDADERGLSDIAIRLYGDTAEFVLNSKNLVSDLAVKTKLAQRAEQALTRAEELKTPETSTNLSTSISSLSVKPSPVPSAPSIPSSSLEVHVAKSKVGKNEGYTDAEKLVLLSTSKINGISYVPFMDIDLKERFQYGIPFTDRDGLLKLAPKQRAEFHEWARPDELYPDPCMLLNGLPDFHSIKQTLISDCSFVASLAVGAQYERRFSKKIITRNIYPQNRHKEPIHNPFGKYMIKLHLNGVARKVIIDDLLPVDKHGRLLCSYTTRKGELWVSLLEKAYMKVMGGYNFPGSNSSIDLHTLTGWIPERISMKSDSLDYNLDDLFNMLQSRLARGDCLVTVATGPLTPIEEERTGLVSTHAYAVLDIRTVMGVRLLKLKNPWSHIRWRGNYSELDSVHWTREMRTAVGFDPESAASFDDGIFWIDYQSIQRFYDTFNVNWNPELFPQTYCIHQQWAAGQGPAKDIYNMGENPQFRLHVPGSGSCCVWVHLSRHITCLEDFKDNREFIAMLVYKTDGSKIYYPYDPPPYIDGVRINSPFYLTKINLKEDSSRSYTLVVSQYEKTANIYFTLKAYSTVPFKLEPIVNNHNHVKQVTGEWKGRTAGGCPNHPSTHPNNPHYLVQLASPGLQSMVIDLKGPKQYTVGFSVEKLEDSSGSFRKRSTMPYRSGFVVLELNSIEPGKYQVIPSTFNPNQEAPFLLTVKATCPVTVSLIK